MSDDNSGAPGRFDEAISVKGATTKATRERQRRIRLNDSFMELAKAIDPGKPPKTDKASIVGDAIRAVTTLRTENGQLQQLNKFLEERCAQLEKHRSDTIMRQAMYQNLNPSPFMQQQAQQQQQQQLPQQPQMMARMAAGGIVMGQPVQGLPLQPGVPLMAPAQPLQGQGQGQGQGQAPGVPQQACSSSRMEMKGENTLGHAMSSQAYGHPSSAMGQLSELLNSDQGIFDWALDSSGSPAEHGWLHLPDGTPPDTTHDHIKRPPAA